MGTNFTVKIPLSSYTSRFDAGEFLVSIESSHGTVKFYAGASEDNTGVSINVTWTPVGSFNEMRICEEVQGQKVLNYLPSKEGKISIMMDDISLGWKAVWEKRG